MKAEPKLKVAQAEKLEEKNPRVRKDLLAFIKGKEQKLSEEGLKQDILGLFDDMLKQSAFTDPEKQGKIARLRARIEIELRDF